MVQKIHHALVDGVSTVEMLVLMSDFSPSPKKIEPSPRRGTRPRCLVARSGWFRDARFAGESGQGGLTYYDRVYA